MEELLALLERYAPGYRGLVHGFHDWYVADLEEAFGQPLPGFYKAFLHGMGEKGGPLLARVHEYPAFHVSGLYQSPSMEMPPRRFLLIFGDSDPLAPMPYWLDREAPTEDGDCEVIRMPFETNAWKSSRRREFHSLREMLFISAMENVCLPTFAHRARYSRQVERPGEAEKLAGIFEKMGFQRLPALHHSLLFERDDAALCLYRTPDGARLFLQAGLRTEDGLRRLQLLLEDHTDLKKLRA